MTLYYDDKCLMYMILLLLFIITPCALHAQTCPPARGEWRTEADGQTMGDHIYIYIYREREREIYMCVYIYIYIYMYFCGQAMGDPQNKQYDYY